MNNEEKILEMLAEMKAAQEEMRDNISQMRGDISQIRGDMSQMQETLTRVAITQENIILPRLDTLADGHKHLLDTLASKSRVEALEEDVSTLKSVVKSMSQRLAALEKAQ